MVFARIFFLLGLICSVSVGGAVEGLQLAKASTEVGTEGVESERFVREDREFMEQIHQTFHKAWPRSGTASLQHGHPTETVYVIIHGLFGDGEESRKTAQKMYAEGANVIIGTLPGHEMRNLKASDNSAGVWLEYAESLGMIARHYGKKVVFVGKSTGANLAVRAAESGYADQLILIQPMFGLTNYVKAGMRIGELLPKKFKKQENGCVTEGFLGRTGANLQDVLNAAQQAETLTHVEYRPLKPSIPVEVYMADKDPVVSRKAIETWAQTYAPQAKLRHNKQAWNHMYNPL